MIDFTCFGVVGNLANHLAQAKEEEDFVDVKVDLNAPKGMFPIYSKNANNFLSRFCISKNELIIDNDFVQIEPELCLTFKASYDNDLLKDLQVTGFAAFNDASKRIKASLISFKKNFSNASKGIGNILPLNDLNDIKDYKISSFLKRQGLIKAYGKTEYIKDYYYYGKRLINWAINTINTQTNVATLEDLRPFIKDKPENILISIGATPYTEFGDENYLQVDDEIYVIIHNTTEEIALKSIENNEFLPNSSILHQIVKQA